MLEYYHCPPGYCQCRRLDESLEECSSVYSYSDENFQCVCDREGMNVLDCLLFNFKLIYILGFLCGRCRYDKGVSVLLNNCKSCGTANLLLILALGMTMNSTVMS